MVDLSRLLERHIPAAINTDPEDFSVAGGANDVVADLGQADGKSITGQI